MGPKVVVSVCASVNSVSLSMWPNNKVTSPWCTLSSPYDSSERLQQIPATQSPGDRKCNEKKKWSFGLLYKDKFVERSLECNDRTSLGTTSGNWKGQAMNANTLNVVSITPCRAPSMWSKPASRATDRKRWRGDVIDISMERAFKEYGPDSCTCKEMFLSGGFYLLTRACMQKKRLGVRGLGGACCSKLVLWKFAHRVCKT